MNVGVNRIPGKLKGCPNVRCTTAFTKGMECSLHRGGAPFTIRGTGYVTAGKIVAGGKPILGGEPHKVLYPIGTRKMPNPLPTRIRGRGSIKNRVGRFATEITRGSEFPDCVVRDRIEPLERVLPADTI